MKGKRIALFVVAAVLLLRLLAPGQTERLRALLLGSDGRQAVEAVCLSFSGNEEELLAVFRENAP